MKETVRKLLSSLATLLLALVVAIIIWITATQAQDPTRSQFLQLPVEYINQPEDSLLTTPQRQSVQLSVEGPESVLRAITPADFRATVDLSQAPYGETVFVPVRIDTAVSDIETSTPLPESVEVHLEQRVSREIPVELDIRGSVARGHSQGDPLIEPQFITITGPASRIEPIEFALVTVFLNNARETNVGAHRPIFYDEQGRVTSTSSLDVSSEEVQVTIPVEEQAGFAEKLITVNWVGEPAPGYRLLSVTVDPPSVLVRGLPERVNSLTRLQTESIDITGLTESFTQQAPLDLPTGITLDQDQEVFVNIEIEPILTTDTRERSVELLGVSEEVEATVNPETVRVVLFGPLPVLDALLDEDVRVTVDLFGLESGTYNVQPNVVLPERGLELRSIQPSAVTVAITRTITETEETSHRTLYDTSSLSLDSLTYNQSAGTAPTDTPRPAPAARTPLALPDNWRQLKGIS